MKRNYRIDNVRALLIILVVVGHLTEIIHYQNSEFVYRWIYIFHMPGFALLSGLCWSGVKDGRVWKKLIYPYVIFQTLYLIFQYVVLNGDFILQYTTPYWLMWYLLALIQWGMLVSTIPISKKNGGIIIIWMCRKTPSFSYGDIRHVHRIYASNWRWTNNTCIRCKYII